MPIRIATNVRSKMLRNVVARSKNPQFFKPATADGRPWEIAVLIKFADEPRALAFERYLKSGSGFAFAKCHFR